MNMPINIMIDMDITLKEDDEASEILKDEEQCKLWIKDNIHRFR